jgi:transposase
MSQRELSRLEVIQRVCRKTFTQRRAADLLALSVRQVKRLCRAFKRSGAAALVSRRRGRPSNNHLRPELLGAARALLRERYYDFGPTLAREKLLEAHGLSLGVESVRRLMIAEGLWRVRRASITVTPPARHQPLVRVALGRRPPPGT